MTVALIDEKEHLHLLEKLDTTDRSGKIYRTSLEELHQKYQEHLNTLKELILAYEDIAAMAREGRRLQSKPDHVLIGTCFISRDKEA